MAASGPTIGGMIGEYRVLSKLGEGGMGVVYLAEDTRLGRKVALKTLAQQHARDPERRKRFVHEARAAAALSHPNVAAVFELEERGEEVFIIFEYVEGRTLRALVDIHGLELAQLLQIAGQIASALEAAHAKGIVHRDLKPENVMLGRSGEVKVLDFGLARFDAGVLGGGSTTQSFGLTQAGTVMGTVGYMSPEQLEGKATDFRSDIFSFGVLIYELASGTHPFAGETPASTIANVMGQEPPPLTASNALHPAELERIVRKCLRKPRDERYQSTRDLLVDLKNLKRDSSGPHAAVAAAPAATTERRILGVPMRTRLWWLLHSLFFLAYVPIPVWFAWRMKDWVPEPMGLTLFFGVIGTLAVAATLRIVQLNFAAWSPEALPQQVHLTMPWLTVANAASLLLLMGMAGNVYVQHTGFAAIVMGVCVVGLLAVFVYEPAMLRQTFPDARVFAATPITPARHVAAIQWIYLLLLASPLVSFTLGSKSLDTLMAQANVWPLVGQFALGAVALLAYGGAIFAAVWSSEAWQGKTEAMRTLRRFFALFVALDYAAIGVWATWLSLGKNTPRPLYFLVFLFVYLPFHQLKLAREVPGSDVALDSSEAHSPRTASLALAAMLVAFAAPYGWWGWRFGQLLGEVAGIGGTTARDNVVMGALVAFLAAGLLLCITSAFELLRAPEEGLRRLARLRALYVAAGIFSAMLAGFQATRLTESALSMLMVALVGSLLALWVGRTARRLAPPEPAAATKVSASSFSAFAPQTWWIAHQFANLLLLAPWVAYWGSFTRSYYPPFGKLMFFALVLLVGARWSLHFVVVCAWAWNRAALAATWQRLAQPLRYGGFGIVAVMLIEGGMAAAKDETIFGAALGALAMGGLVSVVYIEPVLVPPAESR